MKKAHPTPSPHFLFTGFPDLLTRRLAIKLGEAEPNGTFTFLAAPRELNSASEILKTTPISKTRLLTGEVSRLHLGLSGPEYDRLRSDVTHIFHTGQGVGPSADKNAAWNARVEGTRNMLELARESPGLSRMIHFSTTYVCGNRSGIISEDELEAGQEFHNAFEEASYEAERLAQRAAERLPVAILRFSNIVGDSKMGETDRLEGPLYFALSLLSSPLTESLPLLGDGTAPLQVIPMDYAVDAALAISQDPRALGKTFHLVDPNPISVLRFYELAAAHLGRAPPKFNIPVRAAETLLGLPFLERRVRAQRVALQYANQLAFFTSRNTSELLEGKVFCPALPSYLGRVLDFAKAQVARTSRPS